MRCFRLSQCTFTWCWNSINSNDESKGRKQFDRESERKFFYDVRDIIEELDMLFIKHMLYLLTYFVLRFISSAICLLRTVGMFLCSKHEYIFIKHWWLLPRFTKRLTWCYVRWSEEHVFYILWAVGRLADYCRPRNSIWIPCLTNHTLSATQLGHLLWSYRFSDSNMRQLMSWITI